jgi:hypothetical protein
MFSEYWILKDEIGSSRSVSRGTILGFATVTIAHLRSEISTRPLPSNMKRYYYVTTTFRTEWIPIFAQSFNDTNNIMA